MSDVAEFGFAGLAVAPSTHLCAFYGGTAARDDIVVPFLTEGLRTNSKCICILDANAQLGLLARMGGEVDIEGPLERGQLTMASPGEAYLRSGTFSTEEMLEYWETTMSAALDEGTFESARATGEMPNLNRVAQREFFRYEARLNQFVRRYPQVILCLYDLERFSAEVLMDTLRTHPLVLVDGAVHRNPYYIAPDELIAAEG
jgi:hypothetical protein